MIVKANDPDLGMVYKGAKFCFSCHQEITDNAKVWWSGYAPQNAEALDFALHAGCAAKLAVHLGSDALKADLANDQHVLGHGSPLKG